MICGICRDVVKELVWHQLSLDATHVVRWSQSECRCGVEVLFVSVGVASVV